MCGGVGVDEVISQLGGSQDLNLSCEGGCSSNEIECAQDDKVNKRDASFHLLMGIRTGL